MELLNSELLFHWTPELQKRFAEQWTTSWGTETWIFISEVHADYEFDTLIDPVKDDMGLDFVPCGKGEHVKRAERNNQTIAGNIRAISQPTFQSLSQNYDQTCNYDCCC